MMITNARIYPESIWLHRIPDANMPCGSLCEALSGEHSERAGHVLELPLSFSVGVVELGEAGEGVAACCEPVCDGGLVLLDFFLLDVFLAGSKVAGDVGCCEADGRHGDVVVGMDVRCKISNI